jgi:NTP pyrophosphatase (non-canonical NTP hydrolase)
MDRTTVERHVLGITKEIIRAESIHGEFTRDHVRAFIHLVEEVGEVSKELAEVMTAPRMGKEYDDARKCMREELVQVVAVGIMWMDRIDEERRNERA